MNRLEQCLSQRNHTILSPYLTAGFPSLSLTVPLLHKMVDAGADIIELGIPFSDPMAEGVVIQQAMEKALSNGVKLETIFEMVAQFRKSDKKTPIILMGYLNTIEVTGYERFAEKAHQAGVDGTIVVDLPPEEADDILPIWKSKHLDMIFLCSPTTSDERIKIIAKHAGAYVYYVSLKGVTGSANIDVQEVSSAYQTKKNLLKLPLMVGFGIKTPDIAKSIASFADGVVIGAAFLEAINQPDEQSVLESGYHFLTSIRQAID